MAKAEEIKYVLFRFFDFTVEPSKRYRYRVQLCLQNPNFKQETRYLQEAGLASKEFLSTALVGVDRRGFHRSR